MTVSVAGTCIYSKIKLAPSASGKPAITNSEATDRAMLWSEEGHLKVSARKPTFFLCFCASGKVCPESLFLRVFWRQRARGGPVAWVNAERRALLGT